MSIELSDNSFSTRVQQIIEDAERNLQSTIVEKDLPFELDTGYLTVFDMNVIDEKSIRNARERDAVFKDLARDGVQTIMNDIFCNQKKTTIDQETYAVMPPPITRLPREKPIPKPTAPTKWEEYAKAKGIVKKKKEKKVWDETAQDFIPRYGKLRVQIEKDKNWVMEVPRQANPFEDQFAKAANAKKERIAKNEFQRLRNLARAQKSDAPGVGVMTTDTRDTSQLKKAIHFSRHATASLGKFQPTLKNEKDIKGFTKSARNASDKPFVGSINSEKSKSLDIINKIVRPQVNTDSAIIKNVEKEMIMNEIAERRNAKKNVRRSAKGGHANKKSGAALASLTDGKMGDKTSKKAHAKKKAAASAKNAKKNKTLFGDTIGRKTMVKPNGKTKMVSKKRRR